MKLSQQSLSSIESAINQAISRFSSDDAPSVITDIHMQPNSSNGEILIYNDDDDLLASAIISEWDSYDGTDFYKDCERTLRSVLSKIKEDGALESLCIIKPYSFVLVDDDKETISEILLVDDDTLLASDQLLKGLDEELDAFLKDLLEN